MSDVEENILEPVSEVSENLISENVDNKLFDDPTQERAAAYYERKREQGRDYYAANTEKCRAYNRERRKRIRDSKPPREVKIKEVTIKKKSVVSPESRERARVYAKNRYLNNKAQSAERQKEYRRKRRAAYLEYKNNHPELKDSSE
jgi:hypothetical protein